MPANKNIESGVQQGIF